MSETNQFLLSATLSFKETLRYTPAGVPAINFELEYSGEQIEASKPVSIQFHMSAKALGPLALQIDNMALGTVSAWQGFLAPRSQKHKSLQFHVCEVNSAR